MTKEDRQAVCEIIERKGLEGCFVSWSEFDDIDDPRFHKLRKAYLKAMKELEDYLELDEFYEGR